MKTTTAPYTRADYMNGACSHRQYYGQFVTPYIKALVSRFIGKDRLMASKDEHLNDIPLQLWDGISENNKNILAISNELYGQGFSDSDGKRIYSLCNGVCILKEAAKQIIEEEKAK